MKDKLFFVIANFCAVLILTALILTPIYFAKNFAKVAGVKSQSQFLVVSQIEKFPNLKLAQEGDKFTITYTKSAPSQAFVGVLILNNPTGATKTYSIKLVEGRGEVFFAEDLQQKATTISVPSSASVPVSLLSQDTDTNQVTTFSIEVR